MEQFRVIGPFEIAGKKRGEMVELDPAETNIQVLLDCGHVERITVTDTPLLPLPEPTKDDE